jgi:hypothetical protein
MAAGLLALVSACGEPRLISEAKEKVTEGLINPDSAKFRNVRIAQVEGSEAVCGEVNAENRMGGMVGFRPFIYKAPDDVQIADPDMPYSEMFMSEKCGSGAK